MFPYPFLFRDHSTLKTSFIIPIVDDNSALIILLLTSNPNITVIDTIIVSWIGNKSAQSENGIGTTTSPAAANAAVATTACAFRFFSSNATICTF